MSGVEDLGSFDVIIVGSGMGGLVAGNALVKKGYQVLMLEKHIVPGGFTTNFERRGFRFDASIHLINGCEPGGMIYEQLRRIDAHERLEFAKLDTLVHWTDEARGTDTRVPFSLPEHVDLLAKLFPHEERGIRDFYGKYGALVETMFASGEADEGRGSPRPVQEFLALRGKTLKDVLDRYISDPGLAHRMTGLTRLWGLGYDEIDAATFITGDLGYRVQGEGAYYPKGGSGRMSKVLADLFEEKGGTLLLGREVTEITFSRRLADGVVARRRNGRRVAAHGRCIVSDCDLTALVRDLCPAGTFPTDYVEQIEGRLPCCSAVVIYAGIDIDLRRRGIEDYKVLKTWSETIPSSLFNEAGRKGDYSLLPSAGVTIYSNVDPSCCPPGKSVLSAIYLAEFELFERVLDDGRKRGSAYKALKERITAQLVEKMGRALGMPDLESHVEVVELATPITLKRYTNNRDGSFVGWRKTPEQGMFDNIPQQSPVPNLFLCGQWVFPAGGVAPVMMGGNAVAESADGYLSGEGS